MPDAAPRHGRAGAVRRVATMLLFVLVLAPVALSGPGATTGLPYVSAPSGLSSATTTPVPVASPTQTPASHPGRTLYMSPTGSDTASGLSSGTPFRTLRHWTGTFKPGDTVLVRGGTYVTSDGAADTWTPSISGTASAQITIRAYPGETPIFDGQRTTQQFLVLAGVSYLTIEGLTVRDYQPVGNGVFIVADSSHHITIRTVTATGNSGADSSTDQFLYVASGSHDILIDRVSVSGTTAAAVMVGGGETVSNVTVQASHLFGNGRGIIDGDITVGTRIVDNVIEDNAMAQVHFHSNGSGHGSTDVAMAGNILRGTVGLWIESLSVSPVTESNDCFDSAAPFVTGYPLSSARTFSLAQWQASGRGSGTTMGPCS